MDKKALYIEKVTRELLTSSDYIFTLTKSLKDWIVLRHKVREDKIGVLPNGVSTDIFEPKDIYTQKAENLKRELNLHGNIIMYAGYMDEINGIADFVKTIPLIISERPDVSFLFIGNGPGREQSGCSSRGSTLR